MSWLTRLFGGAKELPMDRSFDVILVAGQSNAEGWGANDESLAYTPHHPIYAYDPKKGVALLGERFMSKSETRAGFHHYFADQYVKAGLLEEGRELLIVNTAVGGTGFSDEKWGKGEVLSKRLIKWIKNLKLNPKNRFKALLWHQGETDVINAYGEMRYSACLNELFRDVLKEVGNPRLPIIAGDFVEEWKKSMPASQGYSDATKALLTKFERGGYVHTEGIPGNSHQDCIHFSRKGHIELAARYFKEYENLK